jgi:hypothetical protein
MNDSLKRCALVVFLLGGRLATAQNDYYARQQYDNQLQAQRMQQQQDEQRRMQQQQESQRQQAQQQESQRLEQQRVERSRIENERVNRAQDRRNQEQDDARYEAQQTLLKPKAPTYLPVSAASQTRAVAREDSGDSRRPPSRCRPLVLPKQQEIEEGSTGYFAPTSKDHTFRTTLILGPHGSFGRIEVVIRMKIGSVASGAAKFSTEIDLFLAGPHHEERRFHAISGQVEMPIAIQNTEAGRFKLVATDMVLAEIAGDATKSLPGAACFVAEDFGVSGTWSMR